MQLPLVSGLTPAPGRCFLREMPPSVCGPSVHQPQPVQDQGGLLMNDLVDSGAVTRQQLALGLAQVTGGKIS